MCGMGVCGGGGFLFAILSCSTTRCGTKWTSCTKLWDVCVNFHFNNSLVFGFRLCMFFLFNASLCEWFCFKKIVLKHFCVL